MFRSLLSACSIAVLVLPTLFFPTIARSCPVKSPETLLSLYRNSDAIYVARYDKTEDLDIIEDSGEETVLNIRKHFDVSSALKGEPRKLFTLEEREYRYRIDQSQAPSDPPADEEQDEVDALYSRPSLESGDTVLLFLKNYPQPNGDLTLGLTDYRDAIKKLSGDRLDAYQERIRELNSIFGGKKTADNAEIVDWLVRTTQDPLTRWEGAYELQSSYETMQWQERRKAEEEAAKEEEDESAPDDGNASTEDTEASEEAETETEVELVEEESFDNSVYARLLTDAQKQTLMNVVVESASEQTGSSSKTNKGLREADRVLIELVSNWGDSRLAKFLLDRMQREGESPYIVYRLMATTVTILDDELLEKIAQKYQGLYYEDGDSFVDADDDEEEVADEEEAAADDSDKAVVADENSAEGDEAVSDKDNAEEQSDDSAEQPRRVTYGELRAELMSKFVARTITAIANAEAKELAKAER